MVVRVPAPQAITGATPISGAAGLTPGAGVIRHRPAALWWRVCCSSAGARAGPAGAGAGAVGATVGTGAVGTVDEGGGPTVMSSTACSLAASTRVAEPSAPAVVLRTSTTYAWGASTSSNR